MDDLLRPPAPALALQATVSPEDALPSPAATRPMYLQSRRFAGAAASPTRSLLAVATPARRGKLQLGE